MKIRTTLVAVVALLALIVAAVPAQAQPTNTVTWLAQYYNNIFLSGTTPAFQTQVFNGLNLDFGTGSPDGSIQADNFSGRFTADAVFTQGTYRFSIRADDEFQFRVNDNIVLTTMGAGQPTNILTVDLPLSGNVHLQLDYRERTGNASISLNWQNANAVTTPIPTGTWLAEYFANTSLSQPAAAIFNESTPAHNWGFNAPVNSVPPENWSARWRTSQNFTAGTYRFTARVDDGVRVYVDNTLLIDRFHQSPGSEYIAEIALTAGSHVITVEYLELFNNAFLEFKIEQIGAASPQPGQPGQPTGATVTVRAFRLNVRNEPTTNGSIVIAKVDAGQTFPVTGRTSDNSWYKININGTEGWVSAFWVTVDNAGGVPATQDAPTLTIPAGSIATASVRVNLRSAPSTTNTEILNIIPRFTVAQALGRTADSQWIQVRYDGEVGWVFAPIVNVTQVNVPALPITG